MLVAKLACYLLWKFFFAKNHLLIVAEVYFSAKNHLVMVAEVVCCKKFLVTPWKFNPLLVAEAAGCKKDSLFVAKFVRYSLQKLLVAKNHLLIGA